MRRLPFAFICLFCTAITSCKKSQSDSPSSFTISTLPVSSITENSAISGGKIAEAGYSVLGRGVCFGSLHAPTIADSTITVSGDTGVFICNLSRLSANTTYYVRAFAKTGGDVYYGNEQIFKTKQYSDPPVSLYAAVGNVLYAVDAQSGKLKWQISFPSYLYSSPFYANGMIFIQCSDKKLYAIDTTGSKRWSVSMPTWFPASALAKGGIVYKLDGSGDLFAFDVQSGAELWSVNVGFGDGDINLSDGVIFVNGNYLQALDSKTGALIWSAHYGVGTPVVVNNRVFTIDAGAYQVFEYDAGTGTLVWAYPASPYTTSPFLDGVQLKVHNGYIYGFSTYPNLPGLIVSDTFGSLKWTANVAVGSENPYYEGPQPYFSDSTAYLFDENAGMRCFDANSGAYINGPPQSASRKPLSLTIANGILYYSSDLLYAYDPSVRSVLWTMDIEQNDSAPGVAPCIVGASGNVYLYDRMFDWK